MFTKNIFTNEDICQEIFEYSNIFEYLSHTGSAQSVQHTIVITAAQNRPIKMWTPHMNLIFGAQTIQTKKYAAPNVHNKYATNNVQPNMCSTKCSTEYAAQM